MNAKKGARMAIPADGKYSFGQRLGGTFGAWRIGANQGRKRAGNTAGLAFSPLFLTEKLAGRTVEEVQFGAGRTNDGFMRALRLVVRCGQKVLHVHSGLRAFEKDGTGHRDIVMPPFGNENYGCLRRCWRKGARYYP